MCRSGRISRCRGTVDLERERTERLVEYIENKPIDEMIDDERRLQETGERLAGLSDGR